MTDTHTSSEHHKIALLAFGGGLPVAIIQDLKKRNHPLLVVGFKEFPNDVTDDITISLGQAGKLFKILRHHHITHICLAGGMMRPSWRCLRFDMTGILIFLRLISALKSGDDFLLKKTLSHFVKAGFKPLSIATLCPDLLCPKGELTTLVPTSHDLSTIDHGKYVLNILSPADIGQALSVAGKVVLAVEALEGTDAMIRRCMDIPYAKRKILPFPILLKGRKTHQTQDADLPVFGIETVHHLQASGFKGAALEAGGVLIVDLQETLRAANEAGIFIYGF